MNLNLNRAQISKLHVAMLAALDAPVIEPLSADDAAKQAFCEAVCWADTGDIADLGTLFTLADAIDGYVYKVIYHSDCQYAEVDADALRNAHGAPTVNLALKLVGYTPRPAGQKMRWTDAPDREPTLVVTLPANLLEDWLRL